MSFEISGFLRFRSVRPENIFRHIFGGWAIKILCFDTFWEFLDFLAQHRYFLASDQVGSDFPKIDQNLISKLCQTFFLENTYQIHTKHSAFDASQRDDSAHIFKIFETQKFVDQMIKR